ncbi:MAG: sporulation transcriptional regulator SpoIIID [Clostridia bacterium]|nr:sporulation transcriptional regulator SpoIIID [Clostridia bacterium]
MRTISREERCVTLANYLVENKATVRKVASHFGISKSTVHKDITQKLKRINQSLYQQAKEILDINKQERHIRGGEATKNKYKCKNIDAKNYD